MTVPEFSLGWIWLAGVVSFLSPCVLPILPGYIAYLAGHAAGCDPAKVERWRVLLHGVAFVLGFSLMFIALGATASAAGRLLIGHRSWIAGIGGLLMVVFGLQMAGLIHIPLLEYGARPNVQPNPRWGLASSAVVGFAFATGWNSLHRPGARLGSDPRGIRGISRPRNFNATGSLCRGAGRAVSDRRAAPGPDGPLGLPPQ